MKQIAVLLVVLLFIFACTASKPAQPRTNSPAYWGATDENKRRIASGKIAVGMTIPECQAAWPDVTFQPRGTYTINSGETYQLWRLVQGSRMMYLNVINGVVKSFSENQN